MVSGPPGYRSSGAILAWHPPRLLVTYERITAHTARGFLPGVHAFLDRLEAQLDGAPLPDWQERFVAVRDAYPEWSEHATDPGK